MMKKFLITLILIFNFTSGQGLERIEVAEITFELPNDKWELKNKIEKADKMNLRKQLEDKLTNEESVVHIESEDEEAMIIRERIAKYNLEKLLKTEENAEIIRWIFVYLHDISNWGKNTEILNDAHKTVMRMYEFDFEVCNGGFWQFYWNSIGDFSNEVVDDLIKIGAYKTAEIVKTANEQFPDNNIPKDRMRRLDIVEAIENEAKEIWDKCDYKYYEIQDETLELVVKFIKDNKSDFEK